MAICNQRTNDLPPLMTIFGTFSLILIYISHFHLSNSTILHYKQALPAMWNQMLTQFCNDVMFSTANCKIAKYTVTCFCHPIRCGIIFANALEYKFIFSSLSKPSRDESCSECRQELIHPAVWPAREVLREHCYTTWCRFQKEKLPDETAGPRPD